MQNYADIAIKNSNTGLFSEDNHRAFRDIHDKTCEFRQTSKVCGIPTWRRKRLWNKLYALYRKIKNRFIFPDLVEEASISKHDIQKVLPLPKTVSHTKRLSGVFKSTAEMSLVQGRHLLDLTDFRFLCVVFKSVLWLAFVFKFSRHISLFYKLFFCFSKIFLQNACGFSLMIMHGKFHCFFCVLVWVLTNENGDTINW